MSASCCYGAGRFPRLAQLCFAGFTLQSAPGILICATRTGCGGMWPEGVSLRLSGVATHNRHIFTACTPLHSPCRTITTCAFTYQKWPQPANRDGLTIACRSGPLLLCPARSAGRPGITSSDTRAFSCAGAAGGHEFCASAVIGVACNFHGFQHLI